MNQFLILVIRIVRGFGGGFFMSFFVVAMYSVLSFIALFLVSDVDKYSLLELYYCNSDENISCKEIVLNLPVGQIVVVLIVFVIIGFHLKSSFGIVSKEIKEVLLGINMGDSSCLTFLLSFLYIFFSVVLGIYLFAHTLSSPKDSYAVLIILFSMILYWFTDQILESKFLVEK